MADETKQSDEFITFKAVDPIITKSGETNIIAYHPQIDVVFSDKHIGGTITSKKWTWTEYQKEYRVWMNAKERSTALAAHLTKRINDLDEFIAAYGRESLHGI